MSRNKMRRIKKKTNQNYKSVLENHFQILTSLALFKSYFTKYIAPTFYTYLTRHGAVVLGGRRHLNCSV